MEDYEKLGTFYLGRVYDMDANKPKEELLLYDSKDLVTHAVCVGMTGSGKTGLCISLIEEAAIDGVPSILIDPKGDLADLLLTFPNLSGQDFLPWINLDDAQQKGMAPVDYANKQADIWKNGLASWGQDGTRIQRLRDAADVLIYTPGSNAGFPISILKSFATPPSAILEDEDLLRDRIGTTVTSLLGLVRIEADPVQSREHILLSTILDTAWRQGQDLDLAAIIQQVQKPPVSKIGVLDLESFYSSKDRFSLVLAPLDISQILYTPNGKPRIAIFSISHLSDPERMFFVSLLMNQVLGWMRGQSGTTSLRAIVYMDEIFGFLPPIANPPSKLPMLTLLKQARAFGVGMVLATQNPVDLDYKALGNAGTWFIGRLQTERDKARLLDGLDSAAASSGAQFNRPQIEKILSSLGSRVFLMNNTHEDAPEIFQSRWALSYLRGPLTRDQIKTLMDPLKASGSIGTTGSPTLQANPASPVPVTTNTTQQASLPPDIPSFYIPVRGSAAPGNKLLYLPKILGAAKINYSDPKAKIEFTESKVYITPVTDNAIPVVWDNSSEINVPATDLERSPQINAHFGELASAASQGKNYSIWTRDFNNWQYGTQKVELLRSPSLKEVSQQGESEREFRVRLQQLAREQRDLLVEQLRKKYAPRIATLQERLRKAQQAVDKQAEQAKQAKFQTAISFGSTLLSAFTGRKVSSSTISRASTTMRGVSRAIDESKDVARAGDTVASIQKQLADLQVEFDKETAALEAKIDPSSESLETISIKPDNSDILVQLVSLVWM
ncbi:MAG: ATP-binding protein, partial [Chloroflexi bacterium]|nr:ATP-binding protein [Chloroflexota bacterium]